MDLDKTYPILAAKLKKVAWLEGVIRNVEDTEPIHEIEYLRTLLQTVQVTEDEMRKLQDVANRNQANQSEAGVIGGIERAHDSHSSCRERRSTKSELVGF